VRGREAMKLGGWEAMEFGIGNAECGRLKLEGGEAMKLGGREAGKCGSYEAGRQGCWA
jgi:hypothetical protein